MVTSKPNSQWFPKNHWTCQWSSQINIILKVVNYPVVTISILIWLVCSKVWISCLDIYCRALQLQTKFTSCQLSFCMLYTVTSSPPESFIRIALLFMTLHFTWCLWHFETFYLLYCVNFTLWNDIRSHEIWPISFRLYGCSFTCSAQNLHFSEIDFMHILGATGRPNHR